LQDSQHAVDLRGVRKSFRLPDGQVIEALKNTDLTVFNNEFLTLLGPSGCGKTTLLRIIGGFEMPQAGEVWIDQCNYSGKPPFARPVNTVFQNYAVFPHMTIGENIAYGLENDRMSKAAIRTRVGEMLELVGLAHMEARLPAQLSGGQQQRVALARALAKRPKVLLLDEPLSALDRKLRQKMGIELKHIQRTLGTTFLCVTHDQEEALTLSDRIAVMKDGVIQQLDSPEAVYARPRNRFVADFVGESNLFKGTAHSVNDGLSVLKANTGGEISLHAAFDRPGSEAQVLIRPENFHLREGEQSQDPKKSSIHVFLKERIYQGNDETWIATMLDGGKELKIRTHGTDMGHFKTSQKAWATYAHADVHVLG
jgi:spermidine/putrescine transport system ATP-binding protein